ncbi:MAG: site-2 protease family protein [Syntrophobacteraceae bacterium]|jgi:Zn-dependent protease
MYDVQKIVLSIVPLLFAIILHEVSHGWVAEKLGDPTARLLGRITLNPISHVDLIGTIIVPGILLLTGSHFLFGWAKPVPVNFANLRGGRRDMALVAFSGPLSNFVLAVLSSIIFHLTFVGATGSEGIFDGIIVPIHIMASYSVLFNLVLMAVNLFPILPLDGGRIVAGLAPVRVAMTMERMERYGMLIVLLLIASGIWSYVVGPVIYLFWQILM